MVYHRMEISPTENYNTGISNNILASTNYRAQKLKQQDINFTGKYRKSENDSLSNFEMLTSRCLLNKRSNTQLLCKVEVMILTPFA